MISLIIGMVAGGIIGAALTYYHLGYTLSDYDDGEQDELGQKSGSPDH